MPDDLVWLGDLGQMGARAVGLLAGSAHQGRLGLVALVRADLPRLSEDGGLEELEESLPNRRFSSATRACSVAIRRTCSALATRSSMMTAAWTATVACTSRSREEIAASRTMSGNACLPLGRTRQPPYKHPHSQLVHAKDGC